LAIALNDLREVSSFWLVILSSNEKLLERFHFMVSFSAFSTINPKYQFPQ
jgi:hypothetical protein